MNPEIEQLNQRVTALEAQLQALANTTTIPFPVDRAFRSRLGVPLAGIQQQLVEGVLDNAQVLKAVDEAGTASYNVMNVPDGVLKIVPADGVAVNIPYFNI